MRNRYRWKPFAPGNDNHIANLVLTRFHRGIVVDHRIAGYFAHVAVVGGGGATAAKLREVLMP